MSAHAMDAMGSLTPPFFLSEAEDVSKPHKRKYAGLSALQGPHFLFYSYRVKKVYKPKGLLVIQRVTWLHPLPPTGSFEDRNEKCIGNILLTHTL